MPAEGFRFLGTGEFWWSALVLAGHSIFGPVLFVEVFSGPDPAVMVPRAQQMIPARYNDATELVVRVQPGTNTFDFALESEQSGGAIFFCF